MASDMRGQTGTAIAIRRCAPGDAQALAIRMPLSASRCKAAL